MAPILFFTCSTKIIFNIDNDICDNKKRYVNKFFPLLVCCCCWIRDLRWINSGSGINIPDPQHCTEEACSQHERTSSTTNNTFLHFFFTCGRLLPTWIRIRIQTTKNADPDLVMAKFFVKNILVKEITWADLRTSMSFFSRSGLSILAESSFIKHKNI